VAALSFHDGTYNSAKVRREFVLLARFALGTRP
jgi:hypothetical protein